MNASSTESNDARPGAADAPPGPPKGCPMASLCGGGAGRAPSRFLMMLPGALLILLGVAIVIQPLVLAWLVAGMAVLLGVLLLLMASWVHGLRARVRSAVG